jgi:Dolichyl-phosphate-mannose-protein mannosyltransferase
VAADGFGRNLSAAAPPDRNSCLVFRADKLRQSGALSDDEYEHFSSSFSFRVPSATAAIFNSHSDCLTACLRWPRSKGYGFVAGRRWLDVMDLVRGSVRMMRRLTTSLLVIVVVAFVARVGFAWSQTAKIPRDVVGTVPFQTETGHIAYSLATGKGFASPFQRDSGPTAWLAPVYPLIVAGLFKLFGVYTRGAFFAAIFLNIALSSATCVPIFYVGKRIAGLAAGALGAWLWALFPNAILIPFEWVWDTSLAALLVAVIAWATLEVAESKRWRDWICYGLLWGFALMTNPAVGSVFPFLLAWLAFRRSRGEGLRREWRMLLARPVLAVAVALACCVPWAARNFLVFHRFIPFRSNLAYELYIGNNDNYGERRPGFPPITQELETLRYLRMGETAFMEEEKRKALRFIESHPRMELQLITWRFVDFWMGVPDPSRTFALTDSWLIRGILLGNFLSGLGALVEIVVLFARRSWCAIPLSAFPVVFPLLYYVTHTSLRYRHPIDPVVMVLAAVAVGALFWSRERIPLGLGVSA